MLLMAGVACPALAFETAVLNPSSDAAMYSENGNVADGAGQFLFIGKNSAGAFRRSTIKFNVAGAIPVGATILSASLAVAAGNTQGTNNAATLYRLTEDWTEGPTDPTGSEGSGVTAMTGDTTWTFRNFNSQTWTVAGGSYDNTAAAAISITGTGTYTWTTSSTLTTMLQAWLDTPASNFGWLIVGDETTAGATAKQLSSRQGTTPPVLTLTYLKATYSPVLTVLPSAVATANVGQSITYTVTVSADTITGDGSEVTGISVSGTLGSPLAYASGDTNSDLILQAGEVWVFNSAYTVQSSDPVTLSNNFTIDFDDERGTPHSQTASIDTAINHLHVLQNSPGIVAATEHDTVQLSVAANGGSGEYGYQWFFNDDAKSPQPIDLATYAQLSLDNLQLDQSGRYTCEVTDGLETLVSPAFTLTVVKRVPLINAWGITALAFFLAAFGAQALPKTGYTRRR